MSILNLIIVKDNGIYFSQPHYSQLIELINNRFLDIYKFKRIKNFLDAGYFILDFNTSTIINSQNAFSLEHIKKSERFRLLRKFDFKNV